MKLWRYSGWMLLGTGVIHNAVGLLLGWGTLSQMAHEGWWATVGMNAERNAIFWFLATGLFWMAAGHLLQRWITRHGQPLPAAAGWYMLAWAAAGCLLAPDSGIWLFFPQALIILAARPARYQ
ncbi:MULTISPECIES: DUF6463 family protein [Paenibacillus]|uniref:DUF6463 family protein n=1 Tax=Paenibacillus TaxID=44249 RepID=UPI0022B88D5B|nr:DUF6463 family protein [Paenibacillus caseinilyticus]MCZ8521667.1 DUF6463 family protein [Paenibacillus caseinilyticus]